nr:sugar phosphate isomerase/epimerase [Planctomycetota bacterium]
MMACQWGPQHPDRALLARVGALVAAEARQFHDRHGVALTVHQHRGRPLQTADEVAAYAARFDGVSSALTADTAHLALCGVDPARFLRDFAPLIDLVHLKDLRDGAFIWLGDGTLDLGSCFVALAETGYDRALVADVYESPGPADMPAAARRWIAERVLRPMRAAP